MTNTEANHIPSPALDDFERGEVNVQLCMARDVLTGMATLAERLRADWYGPAVADADTVPGPEYREMRERCYAAEYERDEARTSYSKSAVERAELRQKLGSAALDLANARKEAAEAVATATSLRERTDTNERRLVELEARAAEAKGKRFVIPFGEERERMATQFDDKAARLEEESAAWRDDQPSAGDCYNAMRCDILAHAYRGAAAECRKVSGGLKETEHDGG